MDGSSLNQPRWHTYLLQWDIFDDALLQPWDVVLQNWNGMTNCAARWEFNSRSIWEVTTGVASYLFLTNILVFSCNSKLSGNAHPKTPVRILLTAVPEIRSTVTVYHKSFWRPRPRPLRLPRDTKVSTLDLPLRSLHSIRTSGGSDSFNCIIPQLVRPKGFQDL